MSRIRTVKPAHWSDKNLPNISLQAHLLWIGSWNFSDDDGVFEADPILLRSQIFPRRTDIEVVDIEKWLQELAEQKFILKVNYLEVDFYLTRTFSNHQKIDRKQPGRLPAEIIRRTLDELTANDRKKSALYSRVEESNSKGKVKVKETPTESGARSAPSELQKEYENLDKAKAKISEFIRIKKPQFCEPYVARWNFFAKACKKPAIKTLSESRRKKLLARIREDAFDFMKILQKANESKFITDGTWFSFDWIVANDKNYLKVLEGNYDQKLGQASISGKDKQTSNLLYLVERYHEGQLDPRAITIDVYSTLQKCNLIPRDYLSEFTGETNDEQAIQAVKAWLQLQGTDGNLLPVMPKTAPQ
jgi:hypothetical protein